CCVYVTVYALVDFGKNGGEKMRIRHIEPMEIKYGKTNGKYIELYGNGHNEDGGTPEGETAD
ncbi:TraL conjugative transposon family protein, partial [Prevotella sp. CAG:255]|uniref:TraL conjugative transposon family protein n=1 Tax=Prevotella sp. CAG:255 TaxID=1262923 RepID=UPI002588F97E